MSRTHNQSYCQSLFNKTRVQDTDLTDNLEADESAQAQAEKAELFRSMGVLGKLHNIIVHSRGSSSRIKEFKSQAGRLVPVDNSTRWNSWHNMLTVALEKESAIDQYCKAYFDSLKKDALSPQDWKMLRVIEAFLEPFNDATLKNQGDNVTLDLLLFSMDILHTHMEKALNQHRRDKSLTARIQEAVKKFQEYYQKTEVSPLYAAALILHPSRRTRYAQVCWNKDYQEMMLPKVKELWTTFRDSAESHNIVAYETPEIIPPRRLRAYERLAYELSERTTRPTSQDEYEDYCIEAPYKIRSSPLQWWCESAQKERYPRLSLFAIDILSIPAMSDEPERIFSGGRRTISWERAQLGVTSIEHTECMKSWHRTKILDEI